MLQERANIQYFQENFEKQGLEGLEQKELIKEIEKKMLNYAKELQFEKAALLRDQLEKINKVK